MYSKFSFSQKEESGIDMALKKKNCRLKEERLYMLEVFIDRINFHPDEIHDVNFDNMIMCVKLLDLAPYEINLPRKECQTKDKENLDPIRCSIELECGKSYFFSKTPNSFAKALKSMPLHIEIYSEKSPCTSKTSRTSLCSTKLYLPACLCKQVIETKNQIDGSSIPSAIHNNYNLINEKGNITATVSVILRLSCFGSSIVKHFALEEKSYLIEDLPFKEKFRIPNSVTEDLNEIDKEEKPTKFVLKRPESPPHISLHEPGFEDLTTAEKLNDPKYRNLIYRAYPNEPTCYCLPTNRSTHPLMCRSGCTGPCCMNFRDPKTLLTEYLKHKDSPLRITYCINSLSPDVLDIKHDTKCCGITRLRGGGDVQQLYIGPTGNAWTDYDTEYPWFDKELSKEGRLEGGGGGYDKSTCSCSGGAIPITHMKSTSKEGIPSSIAQDACKPQSRITEAIKPGCVCPGKESSTTRKSNAKCTKKPCLGVDCLIRAFKDAQDFVDSLGKVPGLAGLGLMDPSESPYFGRDIDRDYIQQDSQVEKKKGYLPTSTIPQCGAPCNVQTGKPIGTDSIPAPYATLAPLTLALPGRTGIVREAVPTIPESGSVIVSGKHKKKEDKKEEKIEKQKELDTASSAPLDIDVGPCGEPKCKSRRKKPTDNTVSSDITESSQWKPPTHSKPPSTPTHSKPPNTPTHSKPPSTPTHSKPPSTPTHSKPPSTPTPKTNSKISEKRRSQKTKPSFLGAGGDRNAFAKVPIKVSKQVMRYVYSLGDAYPGINYGHKNCIDLRMRVPANMGWLWNTTATAGNLKPRIGWKPGAIGRYLNELLKEAKAGSLQEANRPRSVPSRSRRSKVYRSMSFSSVKKLQTKKEGEEVVDTPPTLHIHRKDGTYYVTMYPIKQDTSDVPKLAEPMKPLQFKIVKNKDDASVASSSTASDMEIEFSPPAAINRYRRKPDVVHVDTQVRQQEILDAFKPPDSLKKKEKKAKKEKKGKK